MALVVGEVVGHGLHAAATMGRLGVAVHNFSALDLSPDDLLSHLDELVVHIDTDEAAGEEDGRKMTGATCLCAVYDSVTGVCTLARSDHTGPALLHPAALWTIRTCQSGSRLVFFTNGLVADRGGWPQATAHLGADGTAGTVYLRSRPERVPDVQDVAGATANPADPGMVAVSRPSDFLTARGEAKGALTGLVLSLAGVALLVGGGGIANTMVVGVMERRGEIGLGRALGARGA
ncbi:SpoIIE family protein phosphatase [Streptomyces sp. NPDC055749]